MDSTKIVGAGDKRRKNDFYPTPPECTQALIDFLNIPKGATIWECACGDGAISKVLRANGYKVIETDINTGQDFLSCDKAECDWIITNPPFSLAEKFIKQASDHKIPFAFLLKAQYWHSKKRLKLFEENPPYAVLPLTWRPDFTGQGASLMDMSWSVWKRHTTLYIPLSKPTVVAENERK